MKGITSIKIVSQYTLGFIIFNIIYFLNRGMALNGLYFVWIAIVAILSANIKIPKIKYSICVILMVIPMFFTTELIIKIGLCLIAAFSVFYFRRGIDTARYYYYYDEFRKSSITLFIVCILCFFTGSFSRIINISSPYIILYAISSFATLRTLRFMEYSDKNKNLSRLNVIHTSIIVLVSLVFSIDVIRNGIIKLCVGIYDLIVDAILLILKFIFIIIGPGIEYIINKIYSMISAKKVINVTSQFGSNIINKNSLNNKDLLDNLANSRFFHILLWSIILILISSLITRIFKSGIKKEVISEVCIEEKELIISDNNFRKYITKLLSNIAYRKTNNDYIRLYYSKFLILCTKKQIRLELSDTTQEINRKSDIYYNIEITNSFRQKYIKVRYGNYEATTKVLEEFKDEYKQIKNTAR